MVDQEWPRRNRPSWLRRSYGAHPAGRRILGFPRLRLGHPRLLTLAPTVPGASAYRVFAILGHAWVPSNNLRRWAHENLRKKTRS